MRDLALQELARPASMLVALALLGTGGCSSIDTNGSKDAAGSGSGGQSGGETSTGGTATSGECSGLGGLRVIPNVLDFGATLITTTATESVKLVNCGSASVNGIITSVNGGDANLFIVESSPGSLGPGAAATVAISYSPLALETRSLADVTFEGADGEKASLSLFGEPTGAALALAPNPCDFGYVPLMSKAVCCTTVTDQSDLPVHITGVTSFENGDGALAIATTDDSTPPNPQTFPATPITIMGDASAKVCFSLAPTITHQYSGQVTLVTDDPGGVNPVVKLTGWGGGPQISCTPLSIEFGQVAAGTVASVPTICTNIGTAIPSIDLVIDPPTASPSVFTAKFDQSKDPYPQSGLAPGESAQIDVSYSPMTSSSDMGALSIKSNGDRGQTIQIPLTGEGLSLPACKFEIVPASLDFGNQQIGASTTLAFDVMNLGADICLITVPRIGNDATGAFGIVATGAAPDPVTGKITIAASSRLTITIAFSPSSTGAFSAESLFEISDPKDPNQAVSLVGTNEATCLQLAPTSLDFGQLAITDAGIILSSQSMGFDVSNHCQASASIEAIKLQNGPGDTGAQYSRPLGPPLPDSLVVGGRGTYTVVCGANSRGPHPAQLLISDGTVETVLPMTCSVP